MADEIKYITMPASGLLSKEKKQKKSKPIPKKNRIVTDTKRWLNMKSCIGGSINDISFQLHCLDDPIYSTIIESQIYSKLRGYKSQDIEKNRFVEFCILNWKKIHNIRGKRF